jgi:hypothetical protein
VLFCPGLIHHVRGGEVQVRSVADTGTLFIEAVLRCCGRTGGIVSVVGVSGDPVMGGTPRFA